MPDENAAGESNTPPAATDKAEGLRKARAWALVHPIAAALHRNYDSLHEELSGLWHRRSDDGRVATASRLQDVTLPLIDLYYLQLSQEPCRPATGDPPVVRLLSMPRYHPAVLGTVQNHAASTPEFRSAIELLDRIRRLCFHVLCAAPKAIAHYLSTDSPPPSPVKVEVCLRLSYPEAVQLAHYLGMPRQLREALGPQPGLAALEVWDYAERTEQLDKLPAAFRAIERDDLAALLLRRGVAG